MRPVLPRGTKRRWHAGYFDALTGVFHAASTHRKNPKLPIRVALNDQVFSIRSEIDLVLVTGDDDLRGSWSSQGQKQHADGCQSAPVHLSEQNNARSVTSREIAVGTLRSAAQAMQFVYLRGTGCETNIGVGWASSGGSGAFQTADRIAERSATVPEGPPH